jgi:hypothetical protein
LLLRELAEVKDDTLAFLYGGPDQRPGDFEHNLARAAELRRDLTAFCDQNPFYPNWRQAWTAFMAQIQVERRDEADRLAQELADPAPPVPPPDAPPLEPDWSKWVAPASPVPQVIAVDFTAPVQASVTVQRPRWQQRLRARSSL